MAVSGDVAVRSVREGAASRAALWRHRTAPAVHLFDRLALALLTGVGLVAVARFANWWFRTDHVAQPFLFAILSLALWYGVSRIVLGWINYAAASRPAHRTAPAGRRVAIFTTSTPGEPLSMFETTLAACARIRSRRASRCSPTSSCGPSRRRPERSRDQNVSVAESPPAESAA